MIGVEAFTVPEVTAKVTEVAPCCTVTVAGTLAAEIFELATDTTAPPDGATAVRVTVPVPDCPLTMVVGKTETALRAAAIGSTVSLNVAVPPEYEAVSVRDVTVFTLAVVTANVAEVAPCGTVTVDGTLAAVLGLESDTTAPPDGAAAVSVTVPVPDSPLTMVLGDTETALRAAATGFTVRLKVAVPPEYFAVSVTDVTAFTLAVVTANVAEVAPCGTVTVDGTLAAALALERDTTAPPEGAAAVSVTVPVPDCPPTMVLGDTEIALRAPEGGSTVRPNASLAPE